MFMSPHPNLGRPKPPNTFWKEFALSVVCVTLAFFPTLIALFCLVPPIALFHRNNIAVVTIASIASFVVFPLLNIIALLYALFSPLDICWVVYGASESHRRPFEPALSWCTWVNYFFMANIHRDGEPNAGDQTLDGLVLALPTSRMNEEQPNIIQATIYRIHADFGRAKAVALAGRIPSICARHKIELKYPIMCGRVGTVCMALMGVDAANRIWAEQQCTDSGNHPVDDNNKAEAKVEKASVSVIGGGGYMGGLITKKLAADVRQTPVTAIDKVFSVKPIINRNVMSTSDASFVRNTDVVLVFTPDGNAVLPMLDSAVRPGQIWIDDTFPQMKYHTQQAIASRQGDCRKLTCLDPKLTIWPTIPTQKDGWLAGCMVTGIIVALQPLHMRAAFETDVDACERAFKAFGFKIECLPHAPDTYAWAREAGIA